MSARWVILGLLLISLLIFGCTGGATQGGNANTQQNQNQIQTGCTTNNPPCSSDYTCVNNVCVKKDGCLYNNPTCGSGYDCVNNKCVTKSGCTYNNPSCGEDYKCENNQCVEKVICGKFGCQQGESSSNCCTDCGCPTGQFCEANNCKVLKPDLEIANYQEPSYEYSITIFLSRPSLNVSTIAVTNKGNDNAKNVVVKLSSSQGYFEDKSVSIGEIPKNSYKMKNYSLSFTQKGLELTSNTNELVVNTEITYENSANQQFSDSGDFKISVYGKNNVVGYQCRTYSPWITPSQNIIREFATKSTAGLAAGLSDRDKVLAAYWLFASMRAYGVKYVNERLEIGDYVQFPMETLKRKAGDCEDQAILYASLLEAIGIKSAVVVIPGHAFSGFFFSNGSFVPIETTAEDFNLAVSAGSSEYATHKQKGDAQLIVPQDDWNNFPQVIHTKEPSIPLMDIKKQITSTCEAKWSISLGCYFRSTIRFQNNGNAPGAGCARMETYQGGAYRSADYRCITVLAGQTTDYDFTNDYECFTNAACTIH